MSSRLGVIVVREGVVGAGARDVVDAADGAVLLVGSGCSEAVGELRCGSPVLLCELRASETTMARCAQVVAQVVAHAAAEAAGHGRFSAIVLPTSPDGRDLAPRVAALLRWPLISGAVELGENRVRVARYEGRVEHEVAVEGPHVVTVWPLVAAAGDGPVDADDAAAPMSAVPVSPVWSPVGSTFDPSVVGILPADPTTIDLAEATRIVAGGQGLGDADRFAQLGRIGARLGASLGGTRVASDAGWIPFERQIGTTGVAVNPELYVAFAISGATQHTSGLGQPDHIISVNTDGACPMMAMADLAIVSDARSTLDELERLLES